MTHHADDIVFMSNNCKKVQNLVESVNHFAKVIRTCINDMISTPIAGEKRQNILLDDEPLEEFKYVSSILIASM